MAELDDLKTAVSKLETDLAANTSVLNSVRAQLAAAQAAGTVGSANAYANGLGSLGSSASMLALLNSGMFGGSGNQNNFQW